MKNRKSGLIRGLALSPIAAAFAVYGCLVSVDTLATARHEPPSVMISQDEAVAACKDAVTGKLQHPESVDFGIYKVTVQHTEKYGDWLIEGRALAAGARSGQTLPFGYECNVQPFSGLTVAEITDGYGE